MSADHKGNLTLTGELHAKVIKHGPVKRTVNKLRRTRDLTEQKSVDLLKSMRG